MKVWRSVGVLALLVLAAGVAMYYWKQAEPRRNSLQTLQQFYNALAAGNSARILELISLPSALAGRTTAEQSEFLSKALRDEISAEGLVVLRNEGQFGPLTNVFPAEAAGWAKQADVPVEECVAFKLEKNGQRAEVVLWQEATLNPNQPHSLRIVRCNNVKQLAPANL